jgi:hypothetical protein
LTIDIKAWSSNVSYGANYTKDTLTIKWFWQVVAELNEEDTKKLLMFWSGSPVPPMFGFKKVWSSPLSTYLRTVLILPSHLTPCL